ncbi:phage tail tape measure C-terminal domain-containing protein [Aquidulcibacter sp.]|uniref:phage tail tape measure C-terminal domain-containing protein n=1 Tax=Aquidulcibacter sp. TaxID=2052990 RepID=UPI0025BE0123|nr:phage tail tape measure C-terminal domain-containing protein [Aquidulcibacter sp.]MCA3692681.1 phage tail tape measure protein [Aquidulcibacter sp.]
MSSMKNNSFDDELQNAADSLDAFATGPAQAAADALGDAFAKAGKRVSASLAEAARSGEISVRGLAASLVRDLSNLALDRFVTKPIEGAFLQIVKSLPQAGARADGGPVTSGGAYLVGERGPEVFVPANSGQILPNGAAQPISITIHMAPGSNLAEVKRSSTQVAAALARAVQRGGSLL